MARREAGRGDLAATLALGGILILFAFMVGRGWHTLVSNYGSVVSLPVGAAVAFIAICLCYAIAAERVYHQRSGSTQLAYFFFLFIISALGAINAMFLMFQSTNVFREELERSNQAIVSIRDIGAPAISTAEYDRFRSDVSDRWRNLRAEIENPMLCGQGPVAAQRISELRTVLPNFRSLAGGGKCDRIPALVSAYEKQVADLEKESTQFQAAKKKIELREKIRRESAILLDDTNEIRKGFNGLFNVNTVKAKMFDVAERYGLLRQELASAGVTGIDKVPAKIDMSSVSALGDIGQLVPFIISRLSDLSTYIYIVIAVVLDLAVISAFSRVLRVAPSPGTRPAYAGSMRKL